MPALQEGLRRKDRLVTTLALAVDDNDELWTLDSLPISPYVTVGDELVEVRSKFPSSTYTLTGETLPPRIRVRRGIAGTIKASHIQGSTLTPNYGLGGGGGGAGLTVDNQSDPPAEVTTLIAPGADMSTPGTADMSTAVGVQRVSLAEVEVAFDAEDFVDPSTLAGMVVPLVLPQGALILPSLLQSNMWDAEGEVFLNLGDGPDDQEVIIQVTTGRIAPSGSPGVNIYELPAVLGDPSTVEALNINLPKRARVIPERPNLLLSFYSAGDPPTRGSVIVSILIAEPAS
jgi:hypothetical protein